MTKYQLSQKSGISWVKLADVCSGKIKLAQCGSDTLIKIANALEISVEKLLSLDAEPYPSSKNNSLDYLEAALPADLQKAIQDYMEGEKGGSKYLDCLWGEVYGSINANLWGGQISAAQADYLRAKYLYAEEEKDD